nr:putative nucleotidyltransferase, ribonuclease H [Tanacetum cinerariifolium]
MSLLLRKADSDDSSFHNEMCYDVKQSSMKFRENQKLSAKYYGPFQVIAKVGAVAYTLKLPPNATINPTSHVSLLKKHIGPIVPEATLVNTHISSTPKTPLKDATWEAAPDVTLLYPNFDPWGQGST